MSENRIIRLPELQKMVGLSNSTIWRKEQVNSFPKRIKISSRACGWSLHEIQQWMNAQINMEEPNA